MNPRKLAMGLFLAAALCAVPVQEALALRFGGEGRIRQKMTGKCCYATYFPNTDGYGNELSARSVWGLD